MPDEAKPPRQRRSAKRQLWAERLARFAASGLSVIDFCDREGVEPYVFYYWKRLLCVEGELVQFAADPPHAPPAPSAPAVAVEIALPNGAVVRVLPGCDLAFVRSLLAALARPAG